MCFLPSATLDARLLLQIRKSVEEEAQVRQQMEINELAGVQIRPGIPLEGANAVSTR